LYRRYRDEARPLRAPLGPGALGNHVRECRCETEGSEDRRTPDLKTIFELDEAEPYYGPTPGAAEAINAILGLERSTK
jgi:hypothetical protein